MGDGMFIDNSSSFTISVSNGEYKYAINGGASSTPPSGRTTFMTKGWFEFTSPRRVTIYHPNYAFRYDENPSSDPSGTVTGYNISFTSVEDTGLRLHNSNVDDANNDVQLCYDSTEKSMKPKIHSLQLGGTTIVANKADVSDEDTINLYDVKHHTHVVSDITDLSSTLSNKSDVGHTHVVSDITDFEPIELDTMTQDNESAFVSQSFEEVNKYTKVYDGSGNEVDTSGWSNVPPIRTIVDLGGALDIDTYDANATNLTESTFIVDGEHEGERGETLADTDIGMLTVTVNSGSVNVNSIDDKTNPKYKLLFITNSLVNKHGQAFTMRIFTSVYAPEINFTIIARRQWTYNSVQYRIDYTYEVKCVRTYKKQLLASHPLSQAIIDQFTSLDEVATLVEPSHNEYLTDYHVTVDSYVIAGHHFISHTISGNELTIRMAKSKMNEHYWFGLSITMYEGKRELVGWSYPDDYSEMWVSCTPHSDDSPLDYRCGYTKKGESTSSSSSHLYDGAYISVEENSSYYIFHAIISGFKEKQTETINFNYIDINLNVKDTSSSSTASPYRANCKYIREYIPAQIEEVNIGTSSITTLTASTFSIGNVGVTAVKTDPNDPDTIDLYELMNGTGAHTHEISDITGLSTALSGKSDVGHGHAISDVTGLSTSLAGKADVAHSHAISDINELHDLEVGSAYKFTPTITGVPSNGTFEIDTVNCTITIGIGSDSGTYALFNDGWFLSPSDTGMTVYLNSDTSMTFFRDSENHTYDEPGTYNFTINGKQGTVTLSQDLLTAVIYHPDYAFIFDSDTFPNSWRVLFGGDELNITFAVVAVSKSFSLNSAVDKITIENKNDVMNLSTPTINGRTIDDFTNNLGANGVRNIPSVDTNGCMLIGKFLDFQGINNGAYESALSDIVRLRADYNSNGSTLGFEYGAFRPFNIIDYGTSSSNNMWFEPITALRSDLGVRQMINIRFGKANSSGSCGYIGYAYSDPSDSSATTQDSFVGIGMHSYDNRLRVYQNKVTVDVRSSVNPFQVFNPDMGSNDRLNLLFGKSASNSNSGCIGFKKSSTSVLIGIYGNDDIAEFKNDNSTVLKGDLTIGGTINGYTIGAITGLSTDTSPSLPTIPVILSTGVMEIGEYLDFHAPNKYSDDATVRIHARDYGTSGNVLTVEGRFAATKFDAMTIEDTSNATYINPVWISASNLSSGHQANILMGVAQQAYKSGYIGYCYHDTTPYMSIGLHSADNLFKVYKDGHAEVAGDFFCSHVIGNGQDAIVFRNPNWTGYNPFLMGAAYNNGVYLRIYSQIGSNQLMVLDGINLTCQSLAQTSDRRLKTNIKPLSDDIINDLTTYTFNYKDDTENRKHYGLIAQEVQKILPEIVSSSPLSTNAKGDSDLFLNINYIELIPHLIHHCQKQDEEIAALKAQVQELTSLVNSLIPATK